jgi:hypothetical protein
MGLNWMRREVRAVCVGAVVLGLVAGCGAGASGAADEPGESVARAVEPLLTIPGAFYTVAPSFGWCGVPVPGVSGNCHAGYSTNSTLATNTVTRLSTGRFRVFFPGLLAGGNVQISAVGNPHCNLLSVSTSGGGQSVDLTCRTPAGALVDSRFLVSYYRDSNVGGILGGYALVRSTTPPTLSNTWNSSGAAVSVINTGVGAYRVTFPGQVLGGDTALVTAATSAAAYCQLAGWSGAVSVDVRCFSFAGAPQNADFSVSYNRNVRGEPRNTLPTGTQGAFSLVNTAGGINSAFSRNNCPSGSNAATIVLGEYSETYHAVTSFGGEVPICALTTAINTAGVYCNPSHLPIQGVRSDSHLRVNCFTPSGATTNSQHTSMVFLQDQGGC